MAGARDTCRLYARPAEARAAWVGCPGVTDDAALQALVDDLGAAREAAGALAGRLPLGLRAVELAEGRRAYLCAFEGPGFLCLRGDLRAETRERAAHQVATASLLWEQAEGMVDAERLRELAGAIGRALAMGVEGPGVEHALGDVAELALALAVWRDDPRRAVASLADLDAGVAHQERLLTGYGRFVAASEPLAADQDRLAPELVQALRGVEEAAVRAGAVDRLAVRLADAMPGCDEGAGEIVAAHLTRLT
ncbi:MAG: hypothetical protein QOD86_840 [Miltoncostaeaceae bacterium]|nr:hypothetical protein [Miltoncostaeaceae bacterium]